MEIPSKKPIVIAEVGCNHKGQIDLAIEHIKVASLCGADMVKFQKRNNKELLTHQQYNSPHPNPSNSYGVTYGEHREFLEFSVQEHKKLKDFCDHIKIEYSTSVWDKTSAKEISSINPKSIKVPSACNLNFSMLEVLCNEFEGEIHLSFGMTTQEEEIEIINFFKSKGREKDVVIYSCTSGYPVAFQDICLLELKRIREKFGGVVKAIGFSGHHLGIAADIAAMTLGAELIERHFTLDRTWKGTDHAASLEPDGLRKLCRDVKNVYSSLNYKRDNILPVEMVQREKLKWRNS